jgi:hypothetical protein
MNAEVRRIESTSGETGQGIEDRTEITYALGATIDGTFVPFITKSGGYIDHLVAKGEDSKPAGKKASKPKAEPEPDAAA